MSDLSKIDKNYKIETKINKTDIKFHGVEEAGFSIHGIFKEGENYVRLPKDIAYTVNEGLTYLHYFTAGGRLRFRTDSPYVALNIDLRSVGKVPHLSLLNCAGFDLYACEDGDIPTHRGSYIPPYNTEGKYEGVVELGEKKMRDICINFPLFSGVRDVYVGLSDGSKIESPTPYSNKKPVVFYGSSITNGSAASRPGMAYTEILSRRYNLDYINLGFSGSARAEDTIIDYIKGLDMSMYVHDYDHNAPDSEHLEKTHEKMFLAIRQTHPDIPIIIMTRPSYEVSEQVQKRFDIIKRTYDNAISRGDKNVYYIDGPTLSALAKNDWSVDKIHPTDLGFFSMANAVGEVIEKILQK